MIHSRPASNVLVSVGFFLTGILALVVWLVYQLITDPSDYFIAKLILTPALVVIGITIAIKSYFSAVSITLGDNKISYRYLLGSHKVHKINDITKWSEDIVKRKKSEYRSLTIQLTNGKKLRLSNHENSQYDKLVSYLKKK